jgi:energy-coupling factor transporter transmembrane protein EcfT
LIYLIFYCAQHIKLSKAEVVTFLLLSAFLLTEILLTSFKSIVANYMSDEIGKNLFSWPDMVPANLASYVSHSILPTTNDTFRESFIKKQPALSFMGKYG